MNFEEFDYQLLARFMVGDCTPRERERMEAWAEGDPANRKKLEQFKRIWETSDQKRQVLQDFFDTDQEWKRLQSRLEQEDELSDAPTSTPSLEAKRRSASIHSMTQKLARVAAIFLIAGLLGVLAYQNWYQPEPKVQEPVLREVNTANAQRVNLTLSDGTRVMLNAGSTLKFPNRFNSKIREVFVKGEAYFNVDRNPHKPFVVHSRGSIIRVLGTSFTVRSYAEENQVRVVVQEGKVSLENQEGSNADKALLTANEVGWSPLQGTQIETAQVEDMELYMSWRQGYLKFREEPMSNVAKALERRYGVQVSFKDKNISHKTLTAFLKSRSIRNVLDVISMSLDLTYQLDNNKVVFMHK